LTSAKQRLNAKFEWERAFIRSKITGNAGFIGLLMATFDNGDGRGFFVSADQMADLTGLHERTIRQQVKTLQQEGWITVTKRGGNQGGRARANHYALTYPGASQPEESGSQPEESGSQPEDTRAQPEPSARVLDHDSLDQFSLDHLSLGRSSLDISSLQEGDEVGAEAFAALQPEEQDLFVPSFDHDGVMVYSPEIFEAIRRRASHQEFDHHKPVDSRPEWKQKQEWERVLREEGLDENGEPIRKDRPRKTGGWRP
jgi:hypothetical protein